MKPIPHLLAMNFDALTHSADANPSASDQDECEKCGEHMLDCECEE
jgi:hypothetical protein